MPGEAKKKIYYLHIHIYNAKIKTEMKRSFTLSRFLSVAAIAIVMLLAGQSVRAAVTITALNGTGGTGGEGYAKLVDRSSLTKWGHFCFNDDYSYAYVILRHPSPSYPSITSLSLATTQSRTPHATGRTGPSAPPTSTQMSRPWRMPTGR